MPATAQPTGTSDRMYDLVSVLYHALKQAQSCDRYVADAEREGDPSMAGFFAEVRDGHRQRAERAKQLLGRHLSRDLPADAVDEASRESFPGSDPPARISSAGPAVAGLPARG